MRLALVLLCLSLLACNHYVTDAPTDPRQYLTPTSEQQAAVQGPVLPPPAAPAASLPPPSAGGWRAWVPRKVKPNGDVIAGHEIEISMSSRPATLAPLHPIPVAPVFTVPKPAAAAGAPVAPGKPAEVPALPPGLPGSLAPWLVPQPPAMKGP